MLILNIISILLVIVILIVIISVLLNINRRLDEKIQLEKSRIEFYEREIKNIKKTPASEDSVKSLNDIAKEFFREKFNINSNKTYLELETMFKKEGKDKEERFCSLMNAMMYADRTVSSREMNEATGLFADIVEDYNNFK
ncbi:Uncharacterised protein [uncultured archaeon]|nr:Uncharacterised protein [uncultured archaeon]